MSRFRAALLWGLGAGLAAVGALTFVRARRRSYPVLRRSHSHNDYYRHPPLRAALRHGFVSVEADVWPRGGELLVAHDHKELRRGRTLRSLYLEPLAEIVARQGSVYEGLEEPFQLLVEFKDESETAYFLLEEELARFPALVTTYDRDVPTFGPVTVVVTGKVPRQAIASRRYRRVACDGRFEDVGSGVPVSLVPLCSEDWRKHFTWRGVGSFPDAERARLHNLVAEAHADGRKVRFWGAPAWPRCVRTAIWRELAEAGVDYLGADHLASLRRWWRGTLLRSP